MATEANGVTPADVEVAKWLGWDEDRAQPFGSDQEAAVRLVEELGDRGYLVEPDGRAVALVYASGDERQVTRGQGKTLTEALVKAVLKLAA